jgi:hypothetical protein
MLFEFELNLESSLPSLASTSIDSSIPTSTASSSQSRPPSESVSNPSATVSERVINVSVGVSDSDSDSDDKEFSIGPYPFGKIRNKNSTSFATTTTSTTSSSSSSSKISSFSHTASFVPSSFSLALSTLSVLSLFTLISLSSPQSFILSFLNPISLKPYSHFHSNTNISLPSPISPGLLNIVSSAQQYNAAESDMNSLKVNPDTPNGDKWVYAHVSHEDDVFQVSLTVPSQNYNSNVTFDSNIPIFSDNENDKLNPIVSLLDWIIALDLTTDCTQLESCVEMDNHETVVTKLALANESKNSSRIPYKSMISPSQDFVWNKLDILKAIQDDLFGRHDRANQSLPQSSLYGSITDLIKSTFIDSFNSSLLSSRVSNNENITIGLEYGSRGSTNRYRIYLETGNLIKSPDPMFLNDQDSLLFKQYCPSHASYTISGISKIHKIWSTRDPVRNVIHFNLFR